jgi:phosphoglycerate dehydrogenase-like enzyme
MPQLLVDTSIDPARLAELQRGTSLSIAVAPGELDTARALPAELLHDVRAILCTYLPTNHAQMPSLELVQLSSAGFAQVESLGLADRGVAVCTASGVNDIPIAEWTVMMLVALARDLPGMFRNQQNGVWDRGACYQQEIRGRTLGIWGYGGIGRETARLASAMGLRIHVMTRSGAISNGHRFHVEGTGDDAGVIPHAVFALPDVDEFCASLDFLLLAMPQTPENVGIVNRRVFEALPDRAFLLNPARGPLINEKDLLQALRSGKIAGAALDTHFKYPMPADHPLWSMPNVIMTPHVSGSTLSPHFKERLWRLFSENVRRLQARRPLLNALSRGQLEPREASATKARRAPRAARSAG